MLEIIKAIATTAAISQGTAVSLKIINQKNVTDKELGGLIIAFIAVAILNSDNE